MVLHRVLVVHLKGNFNPLGVGNLVLCDTRSCMTLGQFDLNSLWSERVKLVLSIAEWTGVLVGDQASGVRLQASGFRLQIKG